MRVRTAAPNDAFGMSRWRGLHVPAHARVVHLLRVAVSSLPVGARRDVCRLDLVDHVLDKGRVESNEIYRET